MTHYYEVSFSEKRLLSVRHYVKYVEWHKAIDTDEDKEEFEKFLKKEKILSRRCEVTEIQPISEYFYNKIMDGILMAKALF